jgi:hypothetical protein
MLLKFSAQPAIVGGKELTVEQVVSWLKEHGVLAGVDLVAIQKAVEAVCRGDKVSGLVIVHGQTPTEPAAGRVEYFGRSTTAEPLTLLDPARVANPQFSWICRAGDCTARCAAPVSGKPGYTAWNQPLEPLPARAAVLHAGKNVRQTSDALYAEVDGMAALRRGCVDVRKILTFSVDVERQTGPVDFAGEVHIRAAVRSGAVIRARGDIVIEGAVEDACVESTGGNICLKHGVAARHRGLIRAKGNVETGFAENATIQAGGDIVVKVGTMQCNLSAGRAIILNHARGQLIGGVSVAGSYIEAKAIGASGGTRTELIVGLGYDAMLKLAELDAQIARLANTRDDAKELADRIKRAVADPLKLPSGDLERYKELRRAQLALELKLRLLDNARLELLAASAHGQGGEVRILHAALPNVVINIGQASLRIKEPMEACVLVYNAKSGKIEAKI